MNFKHKTYFFTAILFVFQIINPGINKAQKNVSAKIHSKTISGIIMSSESKKPIALAEIFVAGTTVGCISNEKGEFTLTVPYFPCTLVADHISYKSFIENLDGSKNEFHIFLTPENIEILEVKVSGKNKRKQNLRFFYSRFIQDNKNKIKILNDSVLYFKRNDKEFVAYSKEPLLIRNEFLGYIIKVRLKLFRMNKKEHPLGAEIPLKSWKGMEYAKIAGYYFYEPLKPNSIKERIDYEKNRRSTYFGSDRHLLSAVYRGNFEQQGFKLDVFPQYKGLKGFKEVLNYNEPGAGKSFSMDCDSIKITYMYGKDRYPFNYSLQNESATFQTEVSTVYRTNQIFTVFSNGTSPDINITVVGPMTNSGNFANTLPYDYNPFK